jgi:hypothetical protein
MSLNHSKGSYRLTNTSTAWQFQLFTAGLSQALAESVSASIGDFGFESRIIAAQAK